MNIKILLILLILLILYFLWHNIMWGRLDHFRNILPTEIIDPNYTNLGNDPGNWFNWARVGDTRGVDLNCNAVEMQDVLKWINGDSPHLLYEYVYRYDPSVSIDNPLHTPRILKMLLKNLPQKHPYRGVFRRCYPNAINV
jgi:hypothetical protein